MSESWSAKIADRYRCTLSADLADWFDDGAWRQTGIGEFREPLAPQELLGKSPEFIWPGMMVCDLLPIIGNGVGDWLCVRFDKENSASEIVHWYHGAGDWIPWGARLSEAILFDAVFSRFSSHARRYAKPADDTLATAASPMQAAGDPLVQWARKHLPDSVGAVMEAPLSAEATAACMLQAGVAEIAVRCELVVSELHESSAPDNTDPNRGPDWDAAETHAIRVTETAPELAWAWDVAGLAAEQRGNTASAIERYLAASSCSVFTDQSTRLETHRETASAAKFAAARLAELSPDAFDRSPYLRLLSSCDPHAKSTVTEYWMTKGSLAASSGKLDEAHDCYVAAGWDVGAQPIEVYAPVLDRIAETAESAGRVAHAELARTHRRSLYVRFGT